MYHCINCGKQAALRTGNDFLCGICGFAWDVAFEQQMNNYLAAQGRSPAKPEPEPEPEPVQQPEPAARRRKKSEK